MLLYKHILTLKSIDKHMSILDFYTINNKKSIINLKNNAKLFSAFRIKSCLTCRGLSQNLNCYSHIVYRALINKATKKFIV
jgi:hypothetical protein